MSSHDLVFSVSQLKFRVETVSTFVSSTVHSELKGYTYYPYYCGRSILTTLLSYSLLCLRRPCFVHKSVSTTLLTSETSGPQTGCQEQNMSIQVRRKYPVNVRRLTRFERS